MTVLHLGVVDIPYNLPAPKRRNKVGAQPTTGDVAGWLENRYHVMEHFWQIHQADVAGAVERSLAGALETVLMGGPPSHDPFGTAAGAIEEEFRRMVEGKELDRLGYPGIPTRASLEGVSHRFKAKKGPPRPSFVDTGLYVASFKAWVD
jgi:hypothetical protein